MISTFEQPVTVNWHQFHLKLCSDFFQYFCNTTRQLEQKKTLRYDMDIYLSTILILMCIRAMNVLCTAM